MYKLQNLLNTFRLYFWLLTARLFKSSFSSFFFCFVLLFYIQGWAFRLFLVIFDLIFKSRRAIYIDIYWFNIKLLIYNMLSAIFYSNLGDYLEKFSMYFQTPKAARGILAKPYRTLVRYEREWYYQGNPAMFLPDKMWQDLVDIYDRSFGYKYRNFKRKARVEMANFINKPYTTMWRGLVFSFFWILSKRKYLRGFDIRGKISRFLKAWFRRLKVVFYTRGMYIYHGFGKDAILRGDIPALKASPYTFNFKTEQLVTKEEDNHVLPDPEEKFVFRTFDLILSNPESLDYFKPAITNFTQLYTNRYILSRVIQKTPRSAFHLNSKKQ